MLEVKNLSASRQGQNILDDINLVINKGEVHALMGPNGSGKSTLSLALMGHPEIEVSESSKIILDGEDISNMETNERALKGLFLAFQYPNEIPGVSYLDFLRSIYNNLNKNRTPGFKEASPYGFRKIIKEKMNELKMDESFLLRNLNEGFSGGEKKKSEILQMSLLGPSYAILDETDSGLDISALKIVAQGASELAKRNNMGILVITHYNRMLEYLNPTHVHILMKGKIVKSGGVELAQSLEESGYETII